MPLMPALPPRDRADRRARLTRWLCLCDLPLVISGGGGEGAEVGALMWVAWSLLPEDS